jgi:hypothetical protein
MQLGLVDATQRPFRPIAEELELSKCLPLFTQLRTFGGARLPTSNLVASRIFFKQLAK